MKLFLAWSLLLFITISCQTKEKTLSENDQIKANQVILDYYNKQNKGYYEALKSNFSPKVTQFLEMKQTTPAEIITHLKKQVAKKVQYAPDLLKMTVKENNSVQVPVQQKGGNTSGNVLAIFIFDSNHKIVSYREKLRTSTELVKTEKTAKTKSVVGSYVFKKPGHTAGLNIGRQHGSEISYSFTLVNEKCVGEFSGKAFFIKDNQAIGSNSNAQCKLKFTFKDKGVEVLQDTSCHRSRSDCSFSGVYVVAKSPEVAAVQ